MGTYIGDIGLGSDTSPGGGGTWVFRGVHTFVIRIKKYP